MNVSFKTSLLKEHSADVVAVFVHQDEATFSKEIAALARKMAVRITAAEIGDFKGKENESCVVYAQQGKRTRRFLVVGLGERKKSSLERYRRAAATAAKRAKSLKAKTLAIFVPGTVRPFGQTVQALTEGALLSLYKFDKYISKKEENSVSVESLTIVTEGRTKLNEGRASVEKARIISEATALARDLGNAPGNEIYPQTLADAARQSAERSGYRATILDEQEINDLGMGGVIGVSRGSAHPPRFIILEYGPSSKRPVVLVGKGVTFDSGGISIKPSAGMAEMKMDMSGAAAVIGTFEAVARLKLPVHVVGLIPAVENLPSGNAIRPGDILRHYNGKTSEVDNTDAEGRLILADALGYAETFKPQAVIDLATLTGAVVVALGHHATGMMGNDPSLMKQLKSAGGATYERVWQLPLFEEYEKQIKSDIADVKNTGGRWAGSITGGLFLKRFIGNYKWVHLDIAGTAMLEENGDYTFKGASGVGVRLLTEFLRRWK
ncbi:MAG: leucyl aminopeptidase [Ignavibacteriales bacterium]|nr:leucyl aminopeptidase [Ignavibacteriales bacterium]